MKKLPYMTGLALAMSLSAFAVSGAQQGQPQQQRQGQGQQGEFRRGPGGRGGEGFLLRGINLTDNQKTQIKALRDAQRKEFEAKRGQKGEKQGERREARAQRDTTGWGARRAEMQKAREQQVASLRNILTADQRVQFDKNVAAMKLRMEQREGKGRRA